MAKKVLKVATFGLVGSKLVGGKAAPTASVTGTPIMPTPDDAAVKAARRKQAAAAIKRGGRTSTMLTSDETLG